MSDLLHRVTTAAFDTTAALIVVLDRAGKIMRFNAACERLSGHREVDVVGQLLWPLVLDASEAVRSAWLYTQLQPGVPLVKYENHWLTASGERRYLTWATTYLLDDQGEIDLVVATGLDPKTEGDVCSGIGEGEGDRPPEAAGGPGHEGDLAIEVKPRKLFHPSSR